MKIGIVGQGFVGTAINEGLKQHFQIETFDIAKECTCISLEQLSEKSDVVFVCLPTPMKSNGDCHLDIVENTLLALDTIKECKTIVVKSTIPPGTTEKWNKKYKYIQIVFNPEFLTGSTTAEMVKYFLNSFLATKVSFANEMYQICEGLNIDYDKVTEYAKYDERLGKSHLNVPGPDGDFGYGGHCFPKDVKALIQTALEIGLLPKMLIATDEKNNQVRKNRDWEKQKGRAII